MGTEIDKIHHVGHVVQDMETALELYRKLGFVCTPPVYPTMAEQEGEAPKPFGAANAHIDFVDNFIEIVTIVQEGGRIPDNAHLISLSAPPAVRSRIIDSIKRTVATISGCLARFEGTHIWSSPLLMQSLLRLVWNREKSDMEVSTPYNVPWRR